ncbi:MAG: hypothetical protein R6V01_10370, partial [Thermoplasmatota archaeon]
MALVLMAVPFLLEDVSAADTKPVFGSNLSDTTATTGDSFDFGINVTDDYNVSSTYVEYWYGSGTATNSSMSRTGFNWTYQVTIPSDSTDTLYYRFHAVDNASQWAHYPSATTSVSQAVTDNDDPTFTDNSPATGTTGDTYSFDVAASDNVAVSGVSVTWSHGSLSGTNTALSDDGDGTWSLDITLDDSISSMTYTLTVTDSSSNSVTGSTQT